MNSADQIIAKALATVAASRQLREKQDRERREIYEKIQIAALRKPNIPKGIQMRLPLQ